MFNGNLNFWDYLEITTGYDRDKCKRISVALNNHPDNSVSEVAKTLGYTAVTVAHVLLHTQTLNAWIEKREVDKEED